MNHAQPTLHTTIADHSFDRYLEKRSLADGWRSIVLGECTIEMDMSMGPGLCMVMPKRKSGLKEDARVTFPVVGGRREVDIDTYIYAGSTTMIHSLIIGLKLAIMFGPAASHDSFHLDLRTEAACVPPREKHPLEFIAVLKLALACLFAITTLQGSNSVWGMLIYGARVKMLAAGFMIGPRSHA